MAGVQVSRMDRLGRQYQLDVLQAAARHRHSRLIRPHNNEAAAAAGTCDGDPGAAAQEGGAGDAGGPAGAGVMAAATATAAAAGDGSDESAPVTGNAWGTCDVCR